MKPAFTLPFPPVKASRINSDAVKNVELIGRLSEARAEISKLKEETAKTIEDAENLGKRLKKYTNEDLAFLKKQRACNDVLQKQVDLLKTEIWWAKRKQQRRLPLYEEVAGTNPPPAYEDVVS